MDNNALAPKDPFDDDDTRLVKTEPMAMAALNRSEVEAQLSAAHQYPRSIKRFRQEALTLATLSTEVAESCIYSLPRDGKQITGPSVRLAEICASAYGNIHVGARPVDVSDTEVTSQGVAWDLEKNYRATVETKRRITSKSGRRYNEDMILMTQNAASSIALRNAIFRVIPRAFIDTIYREVVRVAVGDAKTLPTKRADVMARLAKLGADEPRVLAAVAKSNVDDIGLAELEILIGLGTAVKNGDKSVDDAFPAPLAPVPAAAAEEGKRMSLGKKGEAPAAKVAAAKPGKAPTQADEDRGDEPGPGEMPEPGSDG